MQLIEVIPKPFDFSRLTQTSKSVLKFQKVDS